MHGAGKKIFADSFNNVSSPFYDFSGLVEIVVQRTLRIDTDDLNFRILLFQIFAHTTDGAAGSHAANEMSDFTFGIFPNFWTCGVVVCFRIGWVVVLIRVVGIGNFAGQLFRNAIVAARVFGLDSRRADDHFRAKGLEQIHFFLGLLIGRGEYAFVATNCRDQRQAHAGVSAGAFNDRAAGLQQAFFLGLVNHADADAVFHGPTRIQHFRLHPDLGLQVLGDAVQTNQRRPSHSFQNIVTAHS